MNAYIFKESDKLWISSEIVLENFAKFRDSILEIESRKSINNEEFVMNVAFSELYNTFKAIGLLLAESYYESATVVYRSMWELSLNLHWIESDFPNRLNDFLNYSTVEFRSVIKTHSDSDILDSYDKITKDKQDKYRKSQKNGKSRLSDNFTNSSICDRAKEIGDPWSREYELVYKLASMYAHGAPASIIHAIKHQVLKSHDIANNNNTSMIGILSVRLMMRIIELLHRMNIIINYSQSKLRFDEFEAAINDHNSPATQQ